MSSSSSGGSSGGSSGAGAAAGGGIDPVRRRELRKNLQRLERQLDSLHRKESDVHDRMAQAAADFTAAAELARELDQVRAEVADVEIEWMAAAEELEDS
jgi:ATP-binding cassette subfamily F protein uup